MSPRLVDTHTHLNFNAFKDDYDEVIERTLKQSVFLVNVGTQFDTSRRAVEIAEQYSDGVYAAVGQHPIHLFESQVDEEETSFRTRGEEFNLASYKELIQHTTKIAAVGEFGLDYYRLPSDTETEKVKEKQKEVVIKHLELAREMDKPIMVHCREAYDDLVPILKQHWRGGGGIIHSFTGTWQQAKLFLELGFLIGLNGIITFDKTGRSEEVVRNLELSQIVLETDAPYLTPVPHRGKRNEPLYTQYVAEKIAEIKGVSVRAVEARTTDNARSLLRI